MGIVNIDGNEVVLFSEILGRTYFKTYAEFFFMCCVARDCLRRGLMLSITDMQIEKGILPVECLNHFKYLVGLGAFYGIDKEQGTVVEEDKRLVFERSLSLYINTDSFTEMGYTRIFKVDGDRLIWSFPYASESYEGYKEYIYSNRKMKANLMHYAAYHVLSVFLGDYPQGSLEIVIEDPQRVQTPNIYICIMSCIRYIDIFRRCVTLNLDLTGIKVDPEYELFCNDSVVANRNSLMSLEEKREVMDKVGIRVGGIYVLWERKGMNPSNPNGTLENCVLVRLDGVSDEALTLTTLNLIKTQEELTDDYYEILPENREKFKDLLDFSVTSTTRDYSLYNMGIQNYVYIEDSLFICRLDEDSKVTKKVTIDGVTADVEMSEINAIYWLLCQFGVDFDASLYKSMYSPEEELLWDIYN